MAGPTANFTHHFLIAMPAMADPNFAHTLTFVCEHNKDGALGIVVNKPTDMTLSTLFEQIDVPLANADRRQHARAFRRPGAGRPRLRAASAARQLAVDACDQRRHRAHDVEGRARSRRAGRRSGERPRFAGLRRLVGRASSSRRSRRTRGSPSKPMPTCCSTRRRRRGCPRRCASSASISRGCPTRSGTRDAWVRRRRGRGHGARVRFRDAQDRRRGRQYARAGRASVDDDQRAKRGHPASRRSRRSSASGGRRRSSSGGPSTRTARRTR